jgi:hypothetical protein
MIRLIGMRNVFKIGNKISSSFLLRGSINLVGLNILNQSRKISYNSTFRNAVAFYAYSGRHHFEKPLK